jgi:uncharacterized membrane protein
MPIRFPLRGFIRSRPHLSLAIALGACAAPLLPEAWRPVTRALVAWDIAVWAYLLGVAQVLLRTNHVRVKAMAAKQDERAALVLATLSGAAFMSLAAIISQLQNVAPDQRLLHYGFTVLTLLGSWLMVALLFCFHYAHSYYQALPQQRPLQFPGPQQEPDYWDFLYFSLTLAVAAQTSDVAVQTRAMRKMVLAQSVLSFFFNLLILGLSINIAAALIQS